MKKINKYLYGFLLGTMTVGLVACDDFDEINLSPSAAGAESMRPDYLLATSFQKAQQNPNDNERVFVYNWASIARVIGENTFGCAARYSDEYNGCLYSFSSNSISAATNAIKLVDENEAAGNYNEREKKYNNNIRQIARIWRCMVIADFTDCFGPYPLNAFQGVNPTFNSVQEVYDFMLSELKDAQSKLVMDIDISEKESKQDAAFKLNPTKWQKLANSLRLRYAMRLSEVDAAKAKSEFEDAARSALLTDNADLFGFQEYGGWSDWEGVYNRPWNDNVISQSMVNILTGIGGIKTAESYNAITESTADITPYVKPMNYIGLEFKNHYPENTDNPMNYQWLDGVPESVDPRAFVLYNLPNDATANTYSDEAKQTVAEEGNSSYKERGMLDTDGETYTWGKINATLTFNGALSGVRTAWSPTFKFNEVVVNSWNTCSFLSEKYRNNSKARIWFGPWETHFLLAEAAVRGWSAGTDAKTAYEAGVTSSFAYHGLERYASAYLASEVYNRVGTSASFDHTAEPVDFEADYVDGYTKTAGKKMYHYPDASKALYKGHKLNDALSKIITQKYIANTPYGVVEMWNDRRRLGLPFFEVPGAENVLTGSDMDNAKNYDPVTQSCKNGQTWGMFTQRMRYPTSLENADVTEYNHALQLLGGENNMMVPLWWAIK